MIDAGGYLKEIPNIQKKKGNKKFLETDYPRGRTIEVFCRFHFGLGAKNRNFIFCPTRNCEKAIPTSPKGR
tara:strand:+ start:151 stop:363 length:213 start_codon:yes stop_codon:yes gene_type:complete